MEDEYMTKKQCTAATRCAKARERCVWGGVMLILSGISVIMDYKADFDTLPLMTLLVCLPGEFCFVTVAWKIRVEWKYRALRELQTKVFMIGIGLFDAFGISVMIWHYAFLNTVIGVGLMIAGLHLFAMAICMKLYGGRLFGEPEEDTESRKQDYR